MTPIAEGTISGCAQVVSPENMKAETIYQTVKVVLEVLRQRGRLDGVTLQFERTGDPIHIRAYESN